MTSEPQPDRYCSLADFEKRFLPKAFAQSRAERPENGRDLGVSMAKESLSELEQRLKKRPLTP